MESDQNTFKKQNIKAKLHIGNINKYYLTFS